MRHLKLSLSLAAAAVLSAVAAAPALAAPVTLKVAHFLPASSNAH